ncbi:MAG: proton-conducting transporter membrane subunit [Thermoplasmatota archaeon]
MAVVLSIEMLLGLLAVGAALSFLTYRLKWVSGMAAFLSSSAAAMVIIAMGVFDRLPEDTVTWGLFDNIDLMLQLGWFSYLFMACIGVLAPLVLMYSLQPMKDRARETPFYGLFMLSVLGGVGVTLARDLLTLFISWELMTWSALLLIGNNRRFAGRAFKIYLGFGMLSAGGILALIALVASSGMGISYPEVAAAVSSGSDGFRIAFLVLGLIAFGTKAGLVPFHIWAPEAYTYTSDSFSAFFSGGLSKTGIYGVFLVIDVFIGMGILATYGSFNDLTGIGLIIAIMGAITALIGGMLAMFQDDAKKLLAYSSVSQLGYIFVGIGIGGSTGTAGALYHVLNHTLFKAVLFMGIGAVIYRTGEHRLSRLGGMIHVMPATFWMFLVGIFAAAAIPITSGLASKWLIYEAALEKGVGVMVPILFLASVSAFLYSFRILQGGFMGQLRTEFKDVKEAPLTMLVPMGIIMMALIVFAFIPGAPMELISRAMGDIGMEAPSYSTIELGSGVGTYSGLVVMISTGIGFVIACLLFFSRPLGRHISLYDTFTAGEEPMEGMDRKFHYAHHFYAPYERVLRPYFGNYIQKGWGMVYRAANQLGRLHRTIFSGDVTAYLWMIFAALLLAGILLWQYGGWF